MGNRTWERDAVSAELHRRLDDGLAEARLTKTQLAARTTLGRTTVQEAFSPKAPVPSPGTITALATALGLPVAELLELRRAAVGETSVPGAVSDALGKPIRDWNAHDLEVHPAGPGTDHSREPVLSGYVPRAHDRMLAVAVSAAMDGRSQMVVLVGASSTGKTRACWEAVQPLAMMGWRLWHPFNPTRAEAAHDALAHVGPRTAVWLNEAQHYLGDPTQGERIAAALHALLTTPERGPVLVLGTLWPEYARRYTAAPAPGPSDPHSRVRELLAGRLVVVPDSFDEKALRDAVALAKAGDSLIADALTRARRSGKMAQDLAGAPQLLDRYRTASPTAKAVLEAAMDARRLGVGLHLQQKFLTDAAIDYLSDDDYDAIQYIVDWEQQALAELAEPVHGKHAPLRPAGPRPKRHPPGRQPPDPEGPEAGPKFRLADYLEHHGRVHRNRMCPPASLWNAAHTHLAHLDDLQKMSEAATARHRLQWAHHLRRRTVHFGLQVRSPGGGKDSSPEEPATPVATDSRYESGMELARSGDMSGAEGLFRQAADDGHARSLGALAFLGEDDGRPGAAESLARRAAEAGDPKFLRRLVELREEKGDRAHAEALARGLAEAGHPGTLWLMVERRERAGEEENADTLVRQLADAGYVNAPRLLEERRKESGEQARKQARWRSREEPDEASPDEPDETGSDENIAERDSPAGAAAVLVRGGEQRPDAVSEAPTSDGPDRKALEEAPPVSPYSLAMAQVRAGDVAGAEARLRQAVKVGDDEADVDTKALHALAVLRERAGDYRSAEALARRAAEAGWPRVLRDIAVVRARAGDVVGAEPLFRQAAASGHPNALRELARWRDEAGDRKGAEELSRQVPEVIGAPDGPRALARWRERTGDRSGAASLYREAADAGDDNALMDLAALRENEGDGGEAAALYREAADLGNVEALRVLIWRTEEEGSRCDVEALYREAADAGLAWHFGRSLDARWPHGLDPDGTPSESWT
ncbi:helix-turn-helix domain-containing protein [Streptomyces globisporus]